MTKLLLPHVPTLVMTSLIQTAEQQIAALAVVFTRVSNVDLTKQTGAGSGVNAAVCVFPWGPATSLLRSPLRAKSTCSRRRTSALTLLLGSADCRRRPKAAPQHTPQLQNGFVLAAVRTLDR